MVKPAEKPKAKPTAEAEHEFNGAQKLSGDQKKPPPAKPYIIKKTWL